MADGKTAGSSSASIRKHHPDAAKSTAAPAAPPGLRERKKARLRQQIVDTSIRLFRERGYQNTRIDDIVGALEISQPTFFRYFPMKSGVLVDAALEGIARTVAELRADLEGNATTPERLREFFMRRVRRLEGDQTFWRAVVLSGAMDPVVSQPVRESDEQMVKILQQILLEGQERGEITRDFPALHLAQTIDGLYKVMVWKWAGDIGGPHNFSEWISSALEIFLRGITPHGS